MIAITLLRIKDGFYGRSRIALKAARYFKI